MKNTMPVPKPRITFRHPHIVDNGKISKLTAGPFGGDDEGEDQHCIDSPIRLVPRD